MPSLASLAELSARRTVDDETKAQAYLDDASNLIRAETNNVWTVGEAVSGQVNPQLVSLDEDSLLTAVPDLLVTVCCKVAGRALDNPSGVESETIGDYAVRYGSSAEVWLTKDDRRTLKRLFGTSGLRSLEVTRNLGAPYQTVDVVYADGGSGEPMPWSDQL